MGPLWGGPSSTDKSNTHYYANYITPPIVRNSPIYYKARPEISNITKVQKEPSGFFSAQLPLPRVFSLSPMTPPERGYTVHIKTATNLLTVKTTPHHLSSRNGVSIYTPPPPTNLLTMGWTLLKAPEIRGVGNTFSTFSSSVKNDPQHTLSPLICQKRPPPPPHTHTHSHTNTLTCLLWGGLSWKLQRP